MAIRVGPDGEMKLILRVQDDGSAVIEEFAEDSEKKLGDSSKKIADNTRKDLDKAGVDWEKFGKRVGLAAGAAVTAAIALGVSTLNAADEMGALSERTGISVESLSAWKFIADQSNTSLGALVPGLRSLAVNMQAAADGQDEQARAFKRLNVEVKDGQGVLRDMDAVMLDLAERFAAMEDGARKTALAQQIFGRGGLELIPILNKGRDGIGELTDKAKQLGLIFTEKSAKAASELKNALGQLSGAIRGVFVQALVGAAPRITAVATALASVAKEGTTATGMFRQLALAMFAPGQEEFIREMEKRLALARRGLEEALKMRSAVDVGMGLKTAQEYRILIATNEQILTDARATLKRMRDEAARPAPARGGGGGGGDGGKAGEEARKKAFDDRIAAMKAAIDWNERMDQAILDSIEVADLQAQADRDRGFALNTLILESQALYEEDVANHLAAVEEKKAKDTAARDDIFLSLFNERETLRFHYEEQFNLLNDLNAQKAISNEDYYALMGRLVRQNMEAQTAIEDAEIKKRFGIAQVYRKLDLGAASSFFGAMAGLMQSGSKKMFAIGKAFAIAETVIQTYKAAQGAYAAFAHIPLVGPALGIAAALAATVAGMARVQAIKKAEVGTDAATPVFSANPNTGLPTSPISPVQEQTLPVQGTAATAPRVVNVHVRGMLSAEMMRDILAPELNEAVGDGVVFNFQTA